MRFNIEGNLVCLLCIYSNAIKVSLISVVMVFCVLYCFVNTTQDLRYPSRYFLNINFLCQLLSSSIRLSDYTYANYTVTFYCFISVWYLTNKYHKNIISKKKLFHFINLTCQYEYRDWCIISYMFRPMPAILRSSLDSQLFVIITNVSQ